MWLGQLREYVQLLQLQAVGGASPGFPVGAELSPVVPVQAGLPGTRSGLPKGLGRRSLCAGPARWDLPRRLRSHWLGGRLSAFEGPPWVLRVLCCQRCEPAAAALVTLLTPSLLRPAWPGRTAVCPSGQLPWGAAPSAEQPYC